MRISMKLRFKCWKSQEFKPCVFFAQGLPDPQQFVEVRYLRELWSIKPLREIIEKCHEKSWSARDAEAKSMSILVVARSCWLTFDGKLDFVCILVSQVEQSSIFAEAEFNEQRHRFLCLSCWCSDHLFLGADLYRTTPASMPLVWLPMGFTWDPLVSRPSRFPRLRKTLQSREAKQGWESLPKQPVRGGSFWISKRLEKGHEKG